VKPFDLAYSRGSSLAGHYVLDSQLPERLGELALSMFLPLFLSKV